MQPDLTLSVISADNLELLLPCLRSVFESTHRVSLDVFVVDNASTDGMANAVAAEFPQIKVIRNAARLGFSTNNNLVLCQGQGRYLMLLNDDTVVLDGAFDALVDFADRSPDVAALGPWLLNPDGTYQQSFAAFPHPLLEPFVSASQLASRHPPPTTPFAVDIVSGACLMVRRSIVKEVGVLDTSFDPIYSEEFDWCYRIKRAGYRIFVVPQARVVHYGSYTMNRTLLRKLELLHGHKVLYFRKHYGFWEAWAYKMLLAVVSVFKGGVLSLVSCCGKADAREKAALQWHLARRALRL